MPAPSTAAQHVSSYSIRIDGRLIEKAYLDAVREVRVVSSLGTPDVCTFKIGLEMPRRQGDPHMIDRMPFSVGKAIEVSLGEKEGRAPSALFKGSLVTVEPTFGAGGVQVLVRALDPAHKLFRGRRVKAYQQQTISDIVRSVCSVAGVPVSVSASGGPLEHVMQANETDWEFIHRLGDRIGFEFVVVDAQAKFRPRARAGAEIVLEYPEQLFEFSPRVTATQQVDSVEVRGYDAKTKDVIVGNATTPAVLSEYGITRSDVHKDFKGAKVLVATEPVEDARHAEKTAQALLDRMGDHHASAEGTTSGNPAIKAGVTIKVEGVGRSFGGKLRVHTATHVLRGGGTYETHFTSSPAATIAGALGGGAMAPGGAGQSFADGLVMAIVTNNRDPDAMGRVKVKFPELGTDNESGWAPVAVPSAGKERGLMMLPVVDEQVLVAFEHGDPSRPIVIGSLFNGKDKPGVELAAEDGSMGLRSDKKLISRAKEEIELEGGKTYTVKVKGDVAETFEAKLTTTVTGEVTLESKQGKLTLKAMQDISLTTTGGNVTISGNMVKIEAKGQLDLSSSGITNVKGTMVNLG
jgi:uncharacterized protein involved in type VI secretion and phage assembly